MTHYDDVDGQQHVLLEVKALNLDYVRGDEWNPNLTQKATWEAMWVIWHGGEFQEGKLTHDHVIFLLPVLMFRCKMISELDVKWFPNVFWAPKRYSFSGKGTCVRESTRVRKLGLLKTRWYFQIWDFCFLKKDYFLNY